MQTPQNPPGPAVCPHCQQADMVRKVSSIYHEGIVAKTHNRARQVQTSLSSRLAPPGQAKTNFGLLIIFATLGGFLLAIFSSGSSGGYSFGFLIFLYMLFWVGLFTMILTKRPTENTSMQVRDMNLALYRWNLLYYCFRDDCVFYPQTSYGVPPEHMAMLLNA